MTVKTTTLCFRLVCPIVLAAVFLFSGCSALKSKKASPKVPSGSPAGAQSQSIYLDFGDVLLPKQLKLDRDHSFVFSTSGFTAGVLSLKGRVDVASLMSFFENKMPVDGWQLISVIKSSRSMLLFRKQTRWCVISIFKGTMSSRVEIWVAPTIGRPGAEIPKEQ